MGGRNRWFCDNGVSQGFVSALLLAPLGAVEEQQPKEEEQHNQRGQGLEQEQQVQEQQGQGQELQVLGQQRPVAVVAPYDEVTGAGGLK